MNWNKRLSDLQFYLAELFPLKEDILHLATKAGLAISSISISDKGIILWFNILTEARRKGLLDELISEVRRLFPEDQVLASFNAEMAEQGNDASKQMLKELCLELVQENHFRNAIPIVEQMLHKENTASAIEEDIVACYATAFRHFNQSEQSDGRRHKKALRYLEYSKSGLVAILMAL